MMWRSWIAIAAVLTAGQVAAQDAALVIGNENYRNASDISAADDALDAAVALENAGFAVTKGSDLSADGLRQLLAEHYAGTEGRGRSVILVSGHFVRAGGETWLLGTEADTPSLADVDRAGLPVATILAMAAERPGAAIVLLGTEDRRISLGRGLERGIGDLDIPQGVTVFLGDAETIAEFAGEAVTEPGQSAADLAERAGGDLVSVGYLGDAAPFLEIDLAQGPAAVPSDAESDTETERALWETARTIDTRPAYDAYLRRYPDGIYAGAARQAIAALDDPATQARATEEALGLSRDQRRQIQRDLSILDIDPRGIDGLFGQGSRNAISTWQRRNGHEPTGFVTAPQMAALAAQAEKRAAELEAEAAARQAEQDRLDRLYWEQTGAAGDEPGLRAYIKRYPDGLFAELAQERLKVFDDERRRQAQAEDRAAWDQALKTNTVQGFRKYLNDYPKGAFADEARQMIAGQPDNAAQDAARSKAAAAEKALGLNASMRSLVERRLAALGLKPGKVDGKFDQDSRRAIRRYQQARGLPVTGFLSQQTVARLLVDSL